MVRHLSRLALMLAVTLSLASARSAVGGPDDPVPFRASTFAWVPWAPTVEEARARGKAEGRLVLAFVFPWDSKAFEDGYDGAEKVRAQEPAAAAAQAEARRIHDPGFVKEQAALTAWLCDPDLAALVARSFVPVRLRMHTWHFFEGGPGPFADPLPRLGTSDRETRPPAVVVATPEGKFVRRLERIGAFEPRGIHRLLLACLRESPRYRPGKPKAAAEFRGAVLDLLAGGDPEEARKRLARPPAPDASWAGVMAAHIDAIEGRLAPAESALRALPPSAERDTALADVCLRRGSFAAALVAAGSSEDPRALVARACALERLGRADEARGPWRALLDAAPDGPRATRARLHLSVDGPRAREWDGCEDFGATATSQTTITGTGGEVAAVRYLLSQQDADGAWRDARFTGGGFDLAVPRTALCVGALRRWHGTPGVAACEEAIARGTKFVARWSENPSDQVWHLTYALHLELDLLAESPSDDGRRRARALLAGVSRIEHDGGWTYTAPPRLHTFNTAPILLLLVRAKELGLPVDAAQIGRAARFLERNRVPRTPVFHYGPTMEHMSGEPGKTDEKSTCMRTPACELALVAAGAEKGTKGLSEAFDLYLARAPSARATQKIFESYVDVTNLQDSYRWFFGAYYAAQCISRLPDARRKKAAARLDALLRAEQEMDGSFVDSQMVGKPSSTALALLALAEVRAALR